MAVPASSGIRMNCFCFFGLRWVHRAKRYFVLFVSASNTLDWDTCIKYMKMFCLIKTHWVFWIFLSYTNIYTLNWVGICKCQLWASIQDDKFDLIFMSFTQISRLFKCHWEEVWCEIKCDLEDRHKNLTRKDVCLLKEIPPESIYDSIWLVREFKMTLWIQY